MSADLETSSQRDGARINLNVDLSPEDCFLMCKQLFMRLKDEEQKEIMDEYLKSKGVSFNLCEETKN